LDEYGPPRLVQQVARHTEAELNAWHRAS
jgi:hypothetical protein